MPDNSHANKIYLPNQDFQLFFTYNAGKINENYKELICIVPNQQWENLSIFIIEVIFIIMQTNK